MAKNKMGNEMRIDLVYDLIHSFDHLDSPTKIANFLEDLLTPTEIRNLSVRLRIAKMLLAGVSQREICIALNTSLITTNKVNNWLKKSGAGFKNAVSGLPTKIEKSKNIPRGPIEYHLPELAFASIKEITINSQERLPKKLMSFVKDK